jgi:hypothetical protein
MLADVGAELTVIARPRQGAVTERLGGADDNRCAAARPSCCWI